MDAATLREEERRGAMNRHLSFGWSCAMLVTLLLTACDRRPLEVIVEKNCSLTLLVDYFESYF